MTDFLTLPDVLSVHADLIERYGGRQGVRSPRHLEAALLRPKAGHYADVIEEAAALWDSRNSTPSSTVTSAPPLPRPVRFSPSTG